MSAHRRGSLGRGLLSFAEYIAVAASVAGAIATFTTHRPIYAVAPLSLAAALGLISRHQTAQQLNKTATALSQEVLEQLPPIHAFDQLNKRLDIVGQQGLRRQETLNNLLETMTQQTQVVQSATQDIQSIRTETSQHKTQLFEQTSAHTEEIQAMQAEITQQQAQLVSAQAQQSEIEAISAAVQQTKSQLDEAIAQLNTTVNNLSQETADALSSQKAQLNTQLDTQLKKQLEETLATVTQPITEQQNRISESTHQLRADNAELFQHIERINNECTALSQQLEQLAIASTAPSVVPLHNEHSVPTSAQLSPQSFPQPFPQLSLSLEPLTLADAPLVPDLLETEND